MIRIRASAARRPGRYHVPGHKGGAGCDPDFREILATQGLQLDIPLVTPGVDIGLPVPPLHRAMELAADAWDGVYFKDQPSLSEWLGSNRTQCSHSYSE